MDISLMRSRITLQKETVVSDSIGNRTNIWIDRHTCRAYVNMQTGGEHAAAGQTVETETLVFTVRYCLAIADITPGSYRILFNGEIYDISAVDDYRFRHETLKLTASRKAR